MCGGCGKKHVVDRDDAVVGMRNCGSKCSNRINVFGALCLWRRKDKSKTEDSGTVVVSSSQCRLKRKVYSRGKVRRKKRKEDDDNEEKSPRSSLIGELNDGHNC